MISSLLLKGDWRDVFDADTKVDALIVDPPYGARTHTGHDAGVDHCSIGDPKWDPGRWRKLSYSAWTPDDVREFVNAWSPRVNGWFCAMSCSDLAHVWRDALHEAGRCTFAPVACVIRAMSVRISGDGPSSWTVYLNVARPRNKEFKSWGTLPGAYVCTRGADHIGGKPLELMSAIVRDYSREGDLVCDPCAGMATTGVAAKMLGRQFVGSEIDPETFAKASERLGNPAQTELFA